MLDSCGKHPHEPGAAMCGRCGGAWCTACLVYAFGPKKPPFCMACAMVAGGVRTGAAPAAMPRKELKARMKAQKAEAKAAAKAAAAAKGDAAPGGPDDAPPSGQGGTDWSAPWWEDAQSDAPAMAD